MPKLKDISSLPNDATELLEAVGYLDAVDLIEADVDELLEELVKANEKLGIASDTPTEEALKEWQQLVEDSGNLPRKEESEEKKTNQESTEEHASSDDEKSDDKDSKEDDSEDDTHAIDDDSGLVNFEEDPDVQEMLAISPEAIPLDPALIRRNKLAVGDIAEGQLLTQCEGEIEINVVTTARRAKAQRRKSDASSTGLMVSRIRSFDQLESGQHHVKPLEKGAPRDVVAPSANLNAGLTPDSRRFVRGVMHPDPVKVKVSAFFAVLVQLMLLANFIGIPWLLIHEYFSGENMAGWVIGLAVALVLSALCYLFWGISARCRVCGQRQFAPKKCIKNKKAHHIPFIGYIFPTALHAIFFKWFYCTYCGTAVRLKK